MRIRARSAVLAAALVAVAALVAAYGLAGSTTTVTAHDLLVTGSGHGSRYYAVIQRTSYGIPHILGATLGDAGFGQGWAYAEDRFCDLDNEVVKVRSQLSRWLGPGPGDIYLGSDLAYLDLGIMARARAQAATLPRPVRELLDGYAAGFNGYLAKTGAGHIQGWCAGQPWITRVSPAALLAYESDLAIQDSGAGFLRAIVTAQPPGAALTALRIPGAEVAQQASPVLGRSAAAPQTASNGWAIGGARSADGRGIILANPHYPWQGPLKFWECQLTVPGQLDVYGASIGGLPGVQIGFNRHVAWTHTVSTSAQYTLYGVRLVPGHPTEYLYDGHPEAMRALHARVMVRGTDGSASPFSYTMWSTRYGPVLNLTSESAQLGWTAARAITYRDADIGNGSLITQWLGLDEATSLRQFQQAMARVQGIPWLNTVAADDRGNAWYIDDSAVPDLSAAAAAAWSRAPFHLLDGSRPAFTWLRQPGARSPGLIPFRDQPQSQRRDYLFNSNDSYWLASPAHPLTGFSPLYGPTAGAQSPRTRENAIALSGTRRLTLPAVERDVLSDRALTSDLLATSVITACQAQGRRPVRAGGRLVDIASACRVLARWNRRFDVSSRGAVIWDELIQSVLGADPDALTSAGPLFQDGFDPARPIRTPGTPARDTGPVLTALAQAVEHLRAAHVPLDATLGSVQHTDKGSRRIPVPGAADQVGILNVVDYVFPAQSLEPPMPDGTPVSGSGLTTDGYVVNDGTSFLMAVEFTAHGPQANALLTFSESEDPASPHFADQSGLLARKFLPRALFTEAQIRSDPRLSTEAVMSGAHA
jgi:acyl-homoserine-lactone acylase